MVRTGKSIMNRDNHAEVVLETHQLTKKFGGLTAVGDVDLRVHKGEICSLIGPNGAGKTTFFNVVTGIYKPDTGSVVFCGENIEGEKPHRIVEKGIAPYISEYSSFSEYDLP